MCSVGHKVLVEMAMKERKIREDKKKKREIWRNTNKITKRKEL